MRKKGNIMKLTGGLVAVAAFLPLAIFGVVSRSPMRILTNASQPVTMRIWIEPAEVVLPVGRTATFRVMADYPDQIRLMPEVKLIISPTEGLDVVEPDISYGQAFSGEVVLGEFEVKSGKKGNYSLSIPPGSVVTGLSDTPVVTGNATVIVQ